MNNNQMIRSLIGISIITTFLSCTSLDVEAKNKPTQVNNIIYMIGDGMGLGHVSAMMIEKKYEPCAFDRAQSIGLVKTFSANNRVTDSAAGGTALATGYKTKNGRLGVTAEGDTVYSILSKAEKMGKGTGLVVTSEIVHATPAAFFSHVQSRASETEIASQLANDSIDILFGGGMKYFKGSPENEKLARKMEDKSYRILDNWEAISKVSSGRVMGLTAMDHMPSINENRGDYLPKATSKALEILTNNCKDPIRKKGFLLMIEGSQIDFASHGKDLNRTIKEVEDFEKAVKVAFDYADSHPGTLVVVTADHETGGLIMPSGNPDFTSSESGIEYKFGSESHTGIMVPVYAYGTGADRFTGILDNTDLPKIIAELAGIK